MTRPLANPALWTALAILATSAGGWQYTIASLKLQLRKLPIEAEDGIKVRDVSTESASWERLPGTTDRRENPEIEVELGTQNYLSRWYTEKNPKDPKNPRSLELHLAYYTGQIDTVPHVPDRCFVGGGMQINRELGPIPLRLDPRWWRDDDGVPKELGAYKSIRIDSGKWSGRYPHLPRDPESIALNTKEYLGPNGVVYSGYFFIANGGHTASANQVRLLAFKLSDTYAYYLKVQVTGTAESPEAFIDGASSLVGDFLGDIMMTVPDWVKVRTGEYPPPTPSSAGSA